MEATPDAGRSAWPRQSKPIRPWATTRLFRAGAREVVFDATLRETWRTPVKAPYDFLVQSATWKLSAISISILRKQFDKTYVAVGFSNEGRAVTMNFILVNGPEGWLIYDVESPHDSLRAFLAQYRN